LLKKLALEANHSTITNNAGTTAQIQPIPN